ncbi:multiple sugar transport system permease protein/putative aldouronate transport system permease protein [Salana multivorans]|uniref:Multiple sugar transport system permease protein/putative aldouronate transport system permease protein n=1 Tax=Salana multivorans TaxID=120377 RepID=A0A3N2DBP9_9MICO|nr:carbohydrate ABC transporter permease [Salana multivorans]MBN8882135.1 carbohydrate ABC transporter permease [Salana multivorans]OJX97656.1 MAG: sugar ABC transporter permease [Micrococcales bacterium 73-15]ROR97220.1 multiple sugar transport system permease protein/putative aldouronate transport system permease protein [Salana multivorans]
MTATAATLKAQRAAHPSKQGTTKVKLGASDYVLRGISYLVVSVFTLFCLLPFVLIISASFSSEAAIMRDGFGLWPKEFSTEAYQFIFRFPRMIIGSYVVTILMTVFGTLIGLFVIAMTGFALQRRDFPYRNHISFFIYFTTLFSAGLAPTYLWVTQVLHLGGTYMAVFLQLLMTPWLIILMKNFARSVPFEIVESGKLDGAGDFRIFLQLVLPMLKPALATVGLFLALGYWNEWYLSSLYLGSAVEFKPLQYYLYNVVNTANALKNSVAGANVTITQLPSNTLKMATAVVATGPIILLYPFVQKYFVTGLTVGAVKG